jgi:hypothetical protein
MNQPEKTLWTDMLAGAVGGALGVLALDLVSTLLYQRENPQAHKQERRVRKQLGASELGPTSVGAHKLNKGLKLHLKDPQEQKLAQGIHYGLGILPGVLYAIARRRTPRIASASGLWYGLLLFLLNDELLSVALGWAAPARRYPWQAHMRGLVSHLALGVATDRVVRLMAPTKPYATNGLATAQA